MAAKKIISMEIGSSLIRVLEIEQKPKNPKVFKSFVMQTPTGTVADGEILNLEELADYIKDELKSNGVSSKQIQFTITSTKIANREVSIPFVKENRIRALIETNANDYFPVDLAEYELSYITLGNDPKVKENASPRIRLMVLAAPKNLLNGYRDLAKACGLTVVGLDYSGNSLFQVTKNASNDDTIMILKIDGGYSMITILSKGSIVLQRTVAYGLAGMASTFGNPNFLNVLRDLTRTNYFQVQIRQNSTALDDDEDLGNFSIGSGKANSDLMNEADILINAISRVINFYNSKNSSEPISHILLTGLGTSVKGLNHYIEQSLAIPVEHLLEVDGHNLEKEFDSDDVGTYIACYGAVIGPVKFAPLGAGDDKKGKKGKGEKKGADFGIKQAILLFAVCLVISIGMCAYALIPYFMAKSENRKLRIQAENMANIIPIYQEYVQSKNAEYYIQTALEYTNLPTEQLADLIEEMENELPSTMYASSLTADKGGISMQVTTEEKMDAADVLVQLREFESITNIHVSAISDSNDEENVGEVKFNVTADYVTGQRDEVTVNREDTLDTVEEDVTGLTGGAEEE